MNVRPCDLRISGLVPAARDCGCRSRQLSLASSYRGLMEGVTLAAPFPWDQPDEGSWNRSENGSKGQDRRCDHAQEGFREKVQHGRKVKRRSSCRGDLGSEFSLGILSFGLDSRLG